MSQEKVAEQAGISTNTVSRCAASGIYIIWKYYLREKTQEQISKESGVSQQAVSQ